MSNLLDKASIILTPTAYNNGEALCVKPSDGSGDFDFSRNSAATRVNAQGLVENVQILSSNLVQNGDFSEEGVEEVSNGSFSQEGVEEITNGDFSSDTGWGMQASWSIANGSANFDGLASHYIQQSNVFAANTNYKLTFTISNNTSGIISIRDGAATVLVPNTNYTNGTYTFYITSTANTSLKIFGVGGSGSLSIDNVSVREVAQDWTLGTGWSIGEDKAIHTGAQSLIRQLNILTIGKTYKITFDLSGADGGGNYAKLVTSQYPEGGANYTSDGTITVYTTTNIDDLHIYGVGDISITNISVKEVGQNWDLGSFTSIGNNVANIVNSTGELSLQQGLGIVQKTIKVTYTISGYVSGVLRVQYGNINGVNRSANGTYTDYITGVAANDNLNFYSLTSDTTASITNISVIEITTDTSLPRINYEGFSYQDALGSEEIVNGDFSNGSANWGSYITGSSTIVFTDVATLNIDASNSNVGIYQENVFTSGKQYKIVLKMKASSSFDAEILETQQASTISTIGSVSLTTSYQDFTFYFTATGSNDIFVHRKFNAASANQSISIDNVSVKEVLGQEVVPDSGCGSWLFEPQSTNLITQSELFSDASWAKLGNSSFGFVTGIAPNGATSVYEITSDGGGGKLQYTISGLAINTEYTLSFYAKKESDITLVQSRILSLTGGSGGTNLTTVNYQNDLITDQWVRITHTFTTNDTLGNYILYISNALTSGDTLQLWGAQVEALSYATSYIPTSGSIVTRNQDLCTNGGSLASINSTEGVLYAEIAALADDGTNRVISLSDGSTANRVSIVLGTISNQIRGQVLSSGTSFDFSTTSYNTLNNNKIAISYKLNDFSMWINGTKVSTDTSGNTPVGMNTISFNAGGGTLPFFGKTKALAVWKEALSDSELQSLTTI